METMALVLVACRFFTAIAGGAIFFVIVALKELKEH